MRGLLLKDWYMTVKYGRFFLVFNIIYAVLGVCSDSSAIFILMNVIMNSMIVKTLMAYEEQSRWDSFSVNLPVTREEIVWEKYLIGFWGVITANAVSCVILAIAGLVRRSGPEYPLMPFVVFYTAVGLIYLAMELPIMFKFGTNAGRIWFVAGTGVVAGICGGIGVGLEKADRADKIMGNVGLWPVILVMLIAAGAAVYFSGKLSVRFYKKREF